jgi:hypothetical protein
MGHALEASSETRGLGMGTRRCTNILLGTRIGQVTFPLLFVPLFLTILRSLGLVVIKNKGGVPLEQLCPIAT